MQVGQQVPILTQQQQSTSTTSNLVNSVEYKDTRRYPHRQTKGHSSGMVQMEIEQVKSPRQERILSGDGVLDAQDSPATCRFAPTRQSCLGGLISDQRSNTKDAFPGLYDVPS